MRLIISFAHVLLGGLATVEAADLAGFVRTNVSVLLCFADPRKRDGPTNTHVCLERLALLVEAIPSPV